MAIGDPRYDVLLRQIVALFPDRGFVVLIEDPDVDMETVVLSNRPRELQARMMLTLGAAAVSSPELIYTRTISDDPPKA